MTTGDGKAEAFRPRHELFNRTLRLCPPGTCASCEVVSVPDDTCWVQEFPSTDCTLCTTQWDNDVPETLSAVWRARECPWGTCLAGGWLTLAAFRIGAWRNSASSDLEVSRQPSSRAPRPARPSWPGPPASLEL
jgi:hypothetical protein